MYRFLKCVAASVSLLTFWRSCTKGVMTWQEPQGDTVVDSSRPWAKERKATMTGTSPIATNSHPRAVGVTPPPRRLRQAKTRRIRFSSANAMPKPRTHSLVVPIQPRGNGIPPGTWAHAAMGESRTTTSVARLTALTALLAAGVVLQPVDLDVLRPLLVSLAEEPFPALVQLIGLKAF